MSKTFTGLAGLLLLAVLTQFYLAAGGAFDAAPTEEAFAPHRVLGYSILAFALLLAVVGALLRRPGRLIGAAGLVAGLVLLQTLIREFAKSLGDASVAGPLVFGLHALNGLAIVAVSGLLVWRSHRLDRTPAEVRAG